MLRPSFATNHFADEMLVKFDFGDLTWKAGTDSRGEAKLKSVLILGVWFVSTVCLAQQVSPRLGDADFPKPSPSKRHDSKVAAVKSGDYDLVLIGDSITHTLDHFGGKYEPLEAIWDKYYVPRKAINLGYSGYRTEQILWHLQHGELEFKRSPKVVVLLIGTNNLDERNFETVHSPEDVYAGTKAIVDLIRKRHPSSRILVLRIFPRGGDDEVSQSPPHFHSSSRCIEACRKAGALTKSLADGKHVFWLDINHVFLKRDGKINAELMWDLLHPSPKGAEAWTKAVLPTIDKLLQPASSAQDQGSP